MQLPLNSAEPQILHIDLNSCFAMVEQQARPLLRGRPVGVTNRKTPNACVVAASYEAKREGVKVGMTFNEAKLLVPGLIMVETDPPKYHFVYQKLINIMSSYSPKIGMKSIDEGIIDFNGTRKFVNQRSLTEIGYEIKQRLKADVGPWMTCNIGIAPNRFLAKQAASLRKPDGLDLIDRTNLRQTLSQLELTDLFGIARRNQARLNAYGIMTPLQFLEAPAALLRKQVFKSVVGEDWYKRLRGYEVDDYVSATKTVGRQYVLDVYHSSEEILRSRLFYLCETTGLKLRHKGLRARGISVHTRYEDGRYWHQRQAYNEPFYTNGEIYRRAWQLFSQRPRLSFEKELGLSCYLLEPADYQQLSLLPEINRDWELTKTLDEINTRHGDFTLTSATSASSKTVVKQKIPFGTTRYFELLCSRA
jgi:DNA polymerase-4